MACIASKSPSTNGRNVRRLVSTGQGGDKDCTLATGRVYAGRYAVEFVDLRTAGREDRADGRLLRHPRTSPVQRGAVHLPLRRARGRIRREATRADRMVEGG